MADRLGPMDGHLDEERLFGLAEGGLDAAARATAEAHVRDCAACKRELEITMGYYKGLADLEPVQAPANFLANVRARLPRPSPLRVFLGLFMRPLRVVPMQLALLVLLGLTAISSYLYQRGGGDGPSPVALSGTAASEAQERQDSAYKNEDAYAEGTGHAQSPPPGPTPAAPLAPAPASPIARAPGEYPDGPVDKNSSGRASREAAKRLSKPLPKSASEPSLEAHGFGAAPRGAAAGMEHEDAPPLAQVAPPPRAPKVASAEPERAANAVAEEERRPASKARKSAPEAEAGAALEEYGGGGIPVFIVALAPGKRIGDVVSGLKAMGVDALSAGAAEDGAVSAEGSKARDYLFQVPSSMRKELLPYLERYGRVEGAGPRPAAETAPARIRIRFLP